MYVRQTFQDVTLDDQSLVDQLIDSSRGTFIAAEAIRTFVCFSQEHPDICLRNLVDHTYNISTIPQRMLKVEYANVDPDLLALATRDPLSVYIDNADQSWSGYHTFHRLITIECLNVMNEHLHFNICGIPTSYYANADSKIVGYFDQAQREGKITSALMYACRHWAYHLSLSILDEALASLTLKFLQNHSLHWLEIVSLVGCDPLWALRPLNNLLSKVSGQCIFDAILLSDHVT